MSQLLSFMLMFALKEKQRMLYLNDFIYKPTKIILTNTQPHTINTLIGMSGRCRDSKNISHFHVRSNNGFLFNDGVPSSLVTLTFNIKLNW